MLARIRYLFRQLRERAFDRRYGVHTRGCMEMPELSGFGEDVRRCAGAYQPTHLRLLPRIIHKSGIVPSQLTFVDLGCGRGRPLLLASRLPFRAVIGVEADGTLASTARANASEWQRRQKCAPIRIACCDARTFDFPAGNLFIYMYNPFTCDVFDAVATRLATLADDPARAVVIAYASPTEAQRLDATGSFLRKPLRPRQFWKPATVLYFYNPNCATQVGLAAELGAPA